MKDTSSRRPLAPEHLEEIEYYWRAANYLSVGQIYLWENPLLREPLKPEHIKPRLLGHWGTCPGINFVWSHLNHQLKERDLKMIYVIGPGHGGPAALANAWLERTYPELYPEVSLNANGMQRLFRQFSFPGGVGSHAGPHVPGALNEGGELGYCLAHAYGAAFDNPDLVACCIIGDGEAETGALAASWHSNKFLNPARDGAVLPVLHLNGYKIANPTLLARIGDEALEHLMRGYGYEPIFVAGSDPTEMHPRMQEALDQAFDRIAHIQKVARSGENGSASHPADADAAPAWPMIVLRTPKGWTGPECLDGTPVEGSIEAHQVPLPDPRGDPQQLKQLEQWMRSYEPDKLFDKDGLPAEMLLDALPPRERRLTASQVPNGGGSLPELKLPPARESAVDVSAPGERSDVSATKNLGRYLREVVRANASQQNFRLFCPDEMNSNRLSAVFDATSRAWAAPTEGNDPPLKGDGRVLEVLSEHMCQGWLEGYTLTGRHGLFPCYEAFVHIIDSMFNQHAKWLKECDAIEWRRPVSAFNYLLTSHVWRQDHNGFTHQDPGFLNHVANKDGRFVRIYLPPDANTLLAVMETCLKSRHVVNVAVCGKHAMPQWLAWEDAVEHLRRGASVWDWAGNEGENARPDVVLGCAGDVPTREVVAAAELLAEHAPELHVRVVNVINLFALAPPDRHPDGLSHDDFDALFPPDVPTTFNFHGYPSLVHELTYDRGVHGNLHVHGYKEEGTTTTPFDMAVRNGIDRFSLLRSVARHTGVPAKVRDIDAWAQDRLDAHRAYIRKHGVDLPELED